MGTGGEAAREYLNAVRDVSELLRAWSRHPAPETFGRQDVEAVLKRSDPYRCLALLVATTWEFMAGLAEARGEADPEHVLDTVLFALQSGTEIAGLTTGDGPRLSPPGPAAVSRGTGPA